MTSIVKKVTDPGGFIGGLTGEGSLKAAKMQVEANREAQEAQAEQIERARGELSSLFDASAKSRDLGFQGALDIFSQSVPAQTQLFQGGNVAAQNQILAGLPQMQNAILGGQVDYSALQPTQLQMPDLSFLQQQLPQAVDPYAPVMGPENPLTGSTGNIGSIGQNYQAGGSFSAAPLLGFNRNMRLR